ncbi:NAD(P)/FAD-dependent oxidoreductase [Rhodomicrobium sp.]|uniref:NAD(P)/FAD-dependent oxidoreductase n=1 Tax=Rhodomicrobium sp. TaxID=2720632 RepID=UPI0039E4CF89
MVRTPHPYDLVIAGASFAGLVAAKTAAIRGLKVAVLEPKAAAGQHVSSTGILTKEAAQEIDLPYTLTRRVYGVRLYAPNLRHVDLFAPDSFFVTTDTGRVLGWLAQEAQRAGAQILWRTPFQGAERKDGVFVFKGVNISARHIIGADGAQSAVARAFGLGLNERFMLATEHEYDGLNADPRFLHCFLDSRLAPGHIAWVAPGPSLFHAGLAARPGRRPRLAAFLAKTAPIFGFEDASLVERRTGRIPCGGVVRPFATDGVTLIGDAAGMASPTTGGGVGFAFQYGRRAAQVVADHLLHLGPSPEVALAKELPRFGLSHLTRLALNLAPPNALLSAALGTAPMRRFAQHVYFRERGGKGISFADFQARLNGLERPPFTANGVAPRNIP